MTDLLNDINKHLIYGEVKIDNGKLFWYYEDDSEDQDILYDSYCEDAQIIRDLGYQVDNAWQDNDSCGFDIIIPTQNNKNEIKRS